MPLSKRLSNTPCVLANGVVQHTRTDGTPMKTVLALIMVSGLGIVARSQGTILFDTHVPGVVDSCWVDVSLSPLGPEWGSRLFHLSGPELLPLLPLTTLKGRPGI